MHDHEREWWREGGGQREVGIMNSRHYFTSDLQVAVLCSRRELTVLSRHAFLDQ